jgi:hypothetical protein
MGEPGRQVQPFPPFALSCEAEMRVDDVLGTTMEGFAFSFLGFLTSLLDRI